MNQLIKARRYVSAPAGTYPAAVVEPIPEPRALDVAGAVDSAIAAVPALVSPALESTPQTSLPPVEVAFGKPGEDFAPADPPQEEPSAFHPKREKAPSHAFGVIMGTVGGAVLGVFAGLMLLVYSFPEPALSQLGDPLSLWKSVGDPLVKTSALLVAAGLMLLGLGVGSWARR